MARHHPAVLMLFGALLVGCVLDHPIIDKRLGFPDLSLDNSESATADQLVTTKFSNVGRKQGIVVGQCDSGTVQRAGTGKDRP